MLVKGKKIIAVMLLVVMIFSLVGCSNLDDRDLEAVVAFAQLWMLQTGLGVFVDEKGTIRPDLLLKHGPSIAIGALFDGYVHHHGERVAYEDEYFRAGHDVLLVDRTITRAERRAMFGIRNSNIGAIEHAQHLRPSEYRYGPMHALVEYNNQQDARVRPDVIIEERKDGINYVSYVDLSIEERQQIVNSAYDTDRFSSSLDDALDKANARGSGAQQDLIDEMGDHVDSWHERELERLHVQGNLPRDPEQMETWHVGLVRYHQVNLQRASLRLELALRMYELTGSPQYEAEANQALEDMGRYEAKLLSAS